MKHKVITGAYKSFFGKTKAKTRSNGFILPLVIALGLGIGTVSLTSLNAITQNSTTLNNQYYSQVAREAAQAGITAALNCIKTTNPLSTAWSDLNTLTPEKNCALTIPAGNSRLAYVENNSDYTSTYSVVKPTYQDPNNTSMLITSVGKVLVKGPNGTSATAAEVTVRGYGVFPENNEVVPTNYKPVRSLSAGPETVCSIAYDKTMNNDLAYCWGSNANGMLGIGKNVPGNRSTSPIAVAQGAVPAMPSIPNPCGGFLQPGCSVQASPAIPGNPMAGKKVTKISVGTSHVCAVAAESNGSNGKAYCWGNNSNGQLGNYSTASSSVPVAVDTDGQKPAIPAIPGYSCGFFCYVNEIPGVPARPASALQNKVVIDITAGEGFTCALTSDYKVTCWGVNDNGQLGTGNRTAYTYPVAVDSTFAGTPAIAAIPANPGVCAWYQWWGACGGYSVEPSAAVPGVAAVPASALLNKNVKKLAQLKNGSTMCVTTSDDDAVCWGQNYGGQVGNGVAGISTSITGSGCPGTVNGGIPITTAVDALRPSAVVGSIKFKSFSIYENYTTAISTTGRAYWWGGTTSTSESREKCGDSNSGGSNAGAGTNKYRETVRRTYVTQSTPAGPLYNSGSATINSSALAFSSGNPRSGLFCAGLSTPNQIYCDANGTGIAEGQTGDGYSPCTNFLGIGCPALPSGVRTVTMSPFGAASIQFTETGTGGYTCAVTTDGQVFCWGANGSGQLGVIPASNRNIPAPVDINLATSALYSDGSGSGSGTTYSAFTLKAVY